MNAAERAVFLGRPEIRHAIRANVDAAPPLSETTKARLAALFAPAHPTPILTSKTRQVQA